MATPRKKFNNYTSPYDKPVQQYPSQSEDYISLDMGGGMSNNAGSNEKTPGAGGYMNTSHFQNSNSKSNRGKNLFNNNSGNKYNNRYTPRKNNDYQQQERYTPRKNNDHQQQERYTPRKDNQGYQNRNQQNVKPASPSISAYCHPSMTEDPWFNLLERVQAIERSKISLKGSSPPQNESTPDEGTKTPDSDNNDDDEVNDDDMQSSE